MTMRAGSTPPARATASSPAEQPMLSSDAEPLFARPARHRGGQQCPPGVDDLHVAQRLAIVPSAVSEVGFVGDIGDIGGVPNSSAMSVSDTSPWQSRPSSSEEVAVGLIAGSNR